MEVATYRIYCSISKYQGSGTKNSFARRVQVLRSRNQSGGFLIPNQTSQHNVPPLFSFRLTNDFFICLCQGVTKGSNLYELVAVERKCNNRRMASVLSFTLRTSNTWKLSAAVNYRPLLSAYENYNVGGIPSYHLLRKFSFKIEKSSNAPIENSNLFLSRLKTITAFIHKLRSKARVDCLDSKEKDLNEKLSASDAWDDSKLATELSQTLAGVRERLSEISTLEQAVSDVTEMYEMAVEEGSDGNENKEVIVECFDALHKMENEIHKKEIQGLMVGKYDKLESCFLQINAGAGGTEACDWVGMIFRMYREYCKLNDYSLTIIDENINPEISNVGYRSITIRLKGKNIYFWIKNEAGVHRLVRISPFDPSKKRHTTFAQVLVYPELDDSKENGMSREDISKEITVDTFRSSGAGGQSVQKTDSAVRITHIPTGLVVCCQNERSQHQNKATAIAVLQSRLAQLNKEKRHDQKLQSTIGVGDNSWGNQIRSVVMQPYQMVKDHRTGWETGNVEGFMLGSLLEESLSASLRHFAEKEEEIN